MSIGWIIFGIFALGALGILALIFFPIIQEEMDKLPWPIFLIVCTIIAIALIFFANLF